MEPLRSSRKVRSSSTGEPTALAGATAGNGRWKSARIMSQSLSLVQTQPILAQSWHPPLFPTRIEHVVHEPVRLHQEQPKECNGNGHTLSSCRDIGCSK